MSDDEENLPEPSKPPVESLENSTLDEANRIEVSNCSDPKRMGRFEITDAEDSLLTAANSECGLDILENSGNRLSSVSFNESSSALSLDVVFTHGQSIGKKSRFEVIEEPFEESAELGEDFSSHKSTSLNLGRFSVATYSIQAEMDSNQLSQDDTVKSMEYLIYY